MEWVVGANSSNRSACGIHCFVFWFFLLVFHGWLCGEENNKKKTTGRLIHWTFSVQTTDKLLFRGKSSVCGADAASRICATPSTSPPLPLAGSRHHPLSDHWRVGCWPCSVFTRRATPPTSQVNSSAALSLFSSSKSSWIVHGAANDAPAFRIF